jgi:hypothetical protein
MGLWLYLALTRNCDVFLADLPDTSPNNNALVFSPYIRITNLSGSWTETVEARVGTPYDVYLYSLRSGGLFCYNVPQPGDIFDPRSSHKLLLIFISRYRSTGQ